jgi:hypothetical protein
MKKEQYDFLETKIVEAAIYVHKEMGPGLLESIYHNCLLEELAYCNLHVRSETFVPFTQVLSYLKLTDKWLGYLMNFNVPVMRDGIKRVVSGIPR